MNMINVVIIEPKGEENLGSIARAMLNMDVSNLILVNPQCNHLSEKALNFAIHSESVLINAIIYNNFSDVLKNSDLSIAITRRTGNSRIKDFDVYDLPDFLNSYKFNRINLIFGRESNGLTNEEISKCDLICSIPSSEKMPSLNLSHAVIVVLYEIFKNSYKKQNDLEFDRKKFDKLYSVIIDTLDNMNFFKNVADWKIKNFIKKIMLRARLSDFEQSVLENIFKSINGIVKSKKTNIPPKK